ncbi:MAG: nucleotidyltransferase family protein [Candidatus Diapherotrites archaeon]|nr:nucleotidyltransferase family protein [Candidatus Diapherotrites archaeon]
MLNTAFILAGGLGTRLSEITKEKQIPKPLVRICEKPIIEWQIEELSSQGIRNFVLGIGYLGNKVREYFNNGQNRGINIFYSEEKELLGTAGALKLAARNYPKLFSESFLMCNGDTLWKIDINKIWEFHKNAKREKCIATLVLVEVEDVSEYGSVVLEKNLIAEFVEKGRKGQGVINSGI